jgi:hypothetical protein
VLQGGESRVQVSRALSEDWKDSPTRAGGAKPVSTIVNHVVRRALSSGYHLEESWRLVPDKGTVLPPGAESFVSGVPVAAPAKPKGAMRELAEKAGVVKPTRTLAKKASKTPVKKTAKKAVKKPRA